MMVTSEVLALSEPVATTSPEKAAAATLELASSASPKGAVISLDEAEASPKMALASPETAE